MSGKSYTMREMKTIVDYLVESKAYGEIRGRKMWMDFASSQLTSRTWQSLKETFLKRILPDIHNPYYKLNNEQINSFRAGYDIKEKNKLEIQEVHAISDESNHSNAKKESENKSNGGSNNVDKNTGENTKSTRTLSSDSTDTVIVETCYETAEDIQRVLESPHSNKDKSKKDKENEKSTTKSFRDCITYSEPLTPMLQEVLDDFASEPDSDLEGRMQIDERVPDSENINNETVATSEVDTNNKVTSNEKEDLNEETCAVQEKLNEDHKAEKSVEIVESVALEKNSAAVVLNETENTKDSPSKHLTPKLFDTEQQTENKENTTVEKVSQNVTSTQTKDSTIINTADSSLPNNQEGLNKDKSNNVEDISSKKLKKNEKSRKRSSSTDKTSTDSKKKKVEKNKLQMTKKKQAKSVPDNVITNVEENVGTLDEITEVIVDKDAEKTTDVEEVPVKSNDPSPVITVHTESIVIENSTEPNNPCLKNISLFDEQFNQETYISSESSNGEQKKVNTEANSKKATEKTNNKQTNDEKKMQDMIVLRSHSDSDTEEIPPLPPKRRASVLSKSQKRRREALANMFGFSSGAVFSRRKRQLSRHRKNSHNNAQNNFSNTSEWTSESDSEAYVSPPRGRKNRHTKKILKPNSARVLSLEEEGGLFVMYGKKIYPIVKDGKIVKNYVTYSPDSASENEDDYWKQKYVAEKKKADELKKLLEKVGENHSSKSESPILQQRSSRKQNTPNLKQTSEIVNGNNNQLCVLGQDPKIEETKVNPPPPPEKIMIKFTKNNEEVHLEGHWPQIHPVLEQVVHIFHKESEAALPDGKAKPTVETPTINELSSGVCTPVNIVALDPEVRVKVDKIEDEIFKEIEEKDKAEQLEERPTSEQLSNVTKRKVGRPRASPSSVAASPAKKPRVTSESEDNTAKNNVTIETENKTTRKVSTRRTKSPTKLLNDSANVTESEGIKTRRSMGKVQQNIEDDEPKYMLPPETKQAPKTSIKTKKQKTLKRSSQLESQKVHSPPYIFSTNSIESSQGYQDSDISPTKSETRKKKRMSLSTVLSRGRRSNRITRAHPYLHCDASDDSSNSSVTSHAKFDIPNSSEAYRSDSYQLLMPKTKQPTIQLERIDETRQFINESNRSSLGRTFTKSEVDNYDDKLNSGLLTSDVGSSSISLPLSPELSIVDDLSMSREVILGAEVYPTINETLANETHNTVNCDQYKISQVDVSMPLMTQECELESYSAVADNTNEKIATSSLLKKIGNFNINDRSNLTDSLDMRLRDLLLESAKKMSIMNPSKDNNMMEVDENDNEKHPAEQIEKKAKSKKRCSTPRKRKTSKQAQAPTVEAVVEEEHVEYLAQRKVNKGRQSCPPAIETYNADIETEVIDIADLTIDPNDKPKSKRKKDVIKVKILRPKRPKISKENITGFSQIENRNSVCIDSGINDSVSGIFPQDESVDLIHNHSETCLHTNECVSNSIELVENSLRSPITVGDSLSDGDHMWNSQIQYDNAVDIPPEFYCNDARDAQTFNTASNPGTIEKTGDTVYHSPIDIENSSLITEDLSDEAALSQPQPRLSKASKWYLLSEEETNTNINIDAPLSQAQTPLSNTKWYSLSEDEGSNTKVTEEESIDRPSSGANLNQIFPITCAVPDLSTITEVSRENDNSTKSTLDGLNADDFNSQSMF